jgi:CheY-like chemotaxis protein
VIEDEPSVSQLLRIVLETHGHEALVADDGSRGLATATRRSPDVIILDVMMPFMDGFAVLEALREDERTVTIPVVMLSAIQKESVEERCYRLGRPSVRPQTVRSRPPPRNRSGTSVSSATTDDRAGRTRAAGGPASRHPRLARRGLTPHRGCL